MIRNERMEDKPLIWTTPFIGSLYNDMKIGIILFIAYLLSHFLASTAIPSLSLELLSLGFQNIVKISQDIQPCSLSNGWILELSATVTHCWMTWIASCKSSNKSPFYIYICVCMCMYVQLYIYTYNICIFIL